MHDLLRDNLPAIREQSDEVERLKQALEPFRDVGEFIFLETDGFVPTDRVTINYRDYQFFDALTVGDFERARLAALNPTQENGNG